MKKKGLLIAAFLLLTCSIPRLHAHHSIVEFDYTKAYAVTGKVKELQWTNPHSWVHVNVKEKDGKVVRYAVEWGGTAQLGNQGVTRDTLKIGDHVVISGNPARNPKTHQVRMLSLHRTKDGFGWGKKPGETFD